jgi:3D (Asp-Asp-Asp) domain-containing protein
MHVVKGESMLAEITVAYLGVVTLTSYRPVKEQTDDSPWTTSIGHRVSQDGVAISQDFLRSGEVCYGDTLVIEGFGQRIVNDVMNQRHTRAVDLWVRTLQDEKKVGVKKARIAVIKSKYRRCKK